MFYDVNQIMVLLALQLLALVLTVGYLGLKERKWRTKWLLLALFLSPFAVTVLTSYSRPLVSFCLSMMVPILDIAIGGVMLKLTRRQYKKSIREYSIGQKNAKRVLMRFIYPH